MAVSRMLPSTRPTRAMHRRGRLAPVVALAGVATFTTVLSLGAAAGPASAASKDSHVAEEGVIVASDLTGSWTSEPNDGSSSRQLEKLAAKVPACKSYVKARRALDRATRAASDSYFAGREDLQNEVWVFKKASQAQKAFALIAEPNNADCLTQVFQSVFEDLVGDDPSVEKLRVNVDQSTDAPAVGDDAVGYEGGVDATLVDGTTERLPLANLLVRVGRALVSYSVSGEPSVSGAYSQTMVDNLRGAVEATIGRLRDAE